MGRWIATWGLLTCYGLTASAFAPTADDYVAAGRVRLFEGTVAGLVQACDIFEAGISDTDGPDGGADRELIFLHAMAETALLFVDHKDVLAPEGFFRLAEAFGVPLDGIAFYESQMDRAAEEQGGGLWPAGATGAELRQTLCDAVLPELDAIIGELNSIGDRPDPFVVYLVPVETGLSGDLEIDYGDVLILRGLLLAYRGLLATQIGQDLALEEAGVVGLSPGDVGPDALPGCSYLFGALSVLGAPDDGNAILTRARQDWVDALACYLSAAEYITGENDPPGTDPQEDEFVYVDRDAQPRLDVYRQMVARLRDSLLRGMGEVDSPESEKTYDLYDTGSTWIGTLTLVFNLKGVEGTSGHVTLADGTSLEVDWFGRLDDEQIGISMYSAQQTLEGWLEGTIDSDLGTLRNGTLDLWGAASSTMTGLTGEIAIAEIPPARSSAAPTAGPGDEVVGQTQQDDPWDEWMPSGFEPDPWQGIWYEPFEAMTPLSGRWVALGRTGEAFPDD